MYFGELDGEAVEVFTAVCVGGDLCWCARYICRGSARGRMIRWGDGVYFCVGGLVCMRALGKIISELR